jgi:hypothetical protein
MYSCRTNRTKRRTGSAVIVALVGLTVTMLLGLTVVKYAVLNRQQLRENHRRTQARMLAESGLARAAAQLDRQREYPGETWRIEPAELADRWPAVVTIEVRPVEGQPQRKTLQASAEYPAGAIDRSRVTLSVPYTLSASGDSP